MIVVQDLDLYDLIKGTNLRVDITKSSYVHIIEIRSFFGTPYVDLFTSRGCCSISGLNFQLN